MIERRPLTPPPKRRPLELPFRAFPDHPGKSGSPGRKDSAPADAPATTATHARRSATAPDPETPVAKNLFRVRNGTGSVVIDGFATKADAKNKRDTLDSPDQTMPQHQWFIMLGPDHKDYQ